LPPSSSRRRGAPLGNQNNFKHGFYSRRLKKDDLSGVEATDSAGLLEEIALIRVFTRQLVESFDPDADFYVHADILRILCLASLAITRVIKAQYFLFTTGAGMSDEISEAIRQVNAEFKANLISSDQDLPANDSLSAPFDTATQESTVWKVLI